MGGRLLVMYEHAREVVTELQDRQKSFATELEYGGSYPRALDLEAEIVKGEAEQEIVVVQQEEEVKQELPRVDGDDLNADELVTRLQAAEEPAGPRLERTVEVSKRVGEGRVGLKLEKCRREVVVCSVTASGPADEVRVQPGDTLLAVNGTPVSSATKASQLIAASAGSVLLTMRCVPGASVVWIHKESATSDFGCGFDWDSRQKQLRVCRVGAAELPFEVGDVVLAINGVRLDPSSSAPKQVAEMLRTAPAGPVGIRLIRAERAIAESLGLIDPESYNTPRVGENAEA